MHLSKMYTNTDDSILTATMVALPLTVFQTGVYVFGLFVFSNYLKPGTIKNNNN